MGNNQKTMYKTNTDTHSSINTSIPEPIKNIDSNDITKQIEQILRLDIEESHITFIVKVMIALHNYEQMQYYSIDNMDDNFNEMKISYVDFCDKYNIVKYKPLITKIEVMLNRVVDYKKEQRYIALRLEEAFRAKEHGEQDKITLALKKPKYTTLKDCNYVLENMHHIKLDRCVTSQKCDYSGACENLLYIPVPGTYDRCVVCTEQYLCQAFEDIKKYCRENLIFPQYNLKTFMKERGYSTFTIDGYPNMSFDRFSEFSPNGLQFTRKDDDIKTGKVLVEFSFSSRCCGKFKNINELGEFIEISEELKQEIMLFLNNELDAYFL